jgi:hypothetical protein
MVEEIHFLLCDEDGPNHENDDADDELLSSEHSCPWKIHLMLEHTEKKKYLMP